MIIKTTQSVKFWGKKLPFYETKDDLLWGPFVLSISF